MMPRRILQAALLLLLALTFAPAALFAQPAPLTDADITRDTACGAAGVGRIYAGPRAEQIEPREGKPGYRVTAEGYWLSGCTPPPPPAPPASCTGDGKPATWTVGANTCTTARPGPPSPTAVRQPIASGRVQILSQWIGPARGTLIERCTDGVRSTVTATCAPATQCDTGWTQRGYAYDARPTANRIPVGGYATATGADGSTLRVRCVAGEIVAAPQCAPGRVTRDYNSEIRVYEYAGPPVDVGARVRAEQLHVIRDGVESPGTNKIRWTMATCAAAGKLQ